VAVLRKLYGGSLALLTDLYQLTMASGYLASGMGEREAAFSVIFRKCPSAGGYVVACGLGLVVEFLEGFRFEPDDIEYLKGVPGTDGKPLFEQDFLNYLRELRFRCDVDAIPEGTVMFPYEPLVRVVGPLAQAQLLETALLNLFNFQSLIATKASRVCAAAGGDPVLEFGFRRAQGIDGGVAAARAAYVGGCVGTSNTMAGKLYGIPIRGTHAHSWVMAFDNELEAFEAYARAMPDNCILLVDTYDSLRGVRNAVKVGLELRRRGHRLIGIRLDSGDLAYLSIESRKILDQAGLTDAVIVGSGDLDERLVASLKQQGAAISVWGVGTRMTTAFDEPALGGVYKLNALREPNGRWAYRVKRSDDSTKSSIPGMLQVRRYRDENGFLADAIYDELSPPGDGCSIFDPTDPIRHKDIVGGTAYDDLLVPVFRKGQRVLEPVSLETARDRAQEQLARLHPTIRRFDNPHRYPAGLERSLYDLRQRMIAEAHVR
jgi:nicotinate phosphoribosyltransferase